MGGGGAATRCHAPDPGEAFGVGLGECGAQGHERDGHDQEGHELEGREQEGREQEDGPHDKSEVEGEHAQYLEERGHGESMGAPRRSALREVADEWGFTDERNARALLKRRQKLQKMHKAAAKRKQFKDPMQRLASFYHLRDTAK